MADIPAFKVRIGTDRESKRARGWATAELRPEEDVGAVIKQLDRSVLGDRELNVRLDRTDLGLPRHAPQPERRPRIPPWQQR